MKASRILLLGAAAVLSAACSKEEIVSGGDSDSRLVPMTFTADMVQTRTQLAEGNAVHWMAGDKIAVFDGWNRNEFTATEVNGSSATFTGRANSSDSYYAFYPYDAVITYYGEEIVFNLPPVQTPVAGTFAPNLAPSYAKPTSGTSFHFENLCALVKFTAGADMDGIISLMGTNKEKLAGRVTYDRNTGELAFPVDNKASALVSLNGKFEAGKTYYFVVAPGTLTNGFSLLYEDSEGKLYRKATDKNTELKAGHILNLGTLSLAGFEKAVIKEIYDALGSGSATANADGTVTISDADVTALAAMTSLNVAYKNLAILGGIGYCTGLTYLSCDRNQLITLNISGLTELAYLACWNNQLTSLDLSKLTKLEYLDYSTNQLPTVDFTMLENLTTLICSGNELTSLDVSMLTNLTSLQCYYNNLTTLDVSMLTNLTDLRCHMNKLNALDIRALSALGHLECGNQQGNLTLTLTSEQNTKWESKWKDEPYNTNVSLSVKD